MDPKKVKKHIHLSNHYFTNAVHFIESGDVEKASEFLWGSVAQAIKALAEYKDVNIKSHEDIKNYSMGLSTSLGDEGIWYAFTEAQSLHSNFYESGLKIEDVAEASERIRVQLQKILKLLPREMLDLSKGNIDG